MSASPALTIVIPTYNDEAWVAGALDSALKQTLTAIEIICVDDASTDGTRKVIEGFRARDPRIRLIVQQTNSSAFQARRVGLEAATAPYVLFLDGDDELAPEAAQVVLDLARDSGADVVGFGVEFVVPEGTRPPAFEASLQPTHSALSGQAILSAHFPVGRPANGHLWRYLFKAAVVRSAYDGLPRNLHLPRANDLPVTFLSLAIASSYVSTPERLYRYFFRRGTSGHRVTNLDGFEFYLGALNSVDLVGAYLGDSASASTDRATALACYESARLSVIGHLLRFCEGLADESLRVSCLSLLQERAGYVELVRAAASFCPESLRLLAKAGDAHPADRSPIRHVLLSTADLSTGGIQGVVVSQARYFMAAGFRVTIAVHRDSGTVYDLPSGVQVVRVDGVTLAARLNSWIDVCREAGADIVIDHHILYNRTWPFFVLAARTLGVRTIGWLQSFALRPLLDDNDNMSFLVENLPILKTVATLSPTDVAFWKLRGVAQVIWLPNPPSPLLLAMTPPAEPKSPPLGPIKLVWWGRLQQSTKRVRSLIPLVVALRERGVDAELTIVGPDTPDLTAAQLLDDAVASGIGDSVQLRGPLHGQALIDVLSAAHVFVSPSVIEGYSLAIVEAQALGLPVAMYDLPWLATLEGNGGVVTAPQGDVQALAHRIDAIVSDPDRYGALSEASLIAARRATEFDYVDLYRRLLDDELPPEFSPEPSLAHARILLEWSAFYAEANARIHIRQRKEVVALRNRSETLRKEVVGLRRKVVSLRQSLRQAGGNDSRLERGLKRLVDPVKRRFQSPAPGPGKEPRAAPTSPVLEPGAVPVRPPSAAPSASLIAPGAAPTTESGLSIDVTVVIPVYNSEPWLDECLSSVLAQTDIAMEVLCVNDGSTDGSRSILSHYGDQDPRVRIIDQPNSGQSVGRNAGIDAAAGRYVIFLDSDDFWSRDALSTLVRRADDEQLDVLLFDGHAVRDGDVTDEVWERYAHYYPRARDYGDVRSGVEMVVGMRRGRDYRVHVGLYLARTDHIRRSKARFIPGIVHQDNPFTFKLLVSAPRTAHASTDLYARRLRAGSTITTLKAANSAKGYFLGYLAMMRQLADLDATPAQAEVLAEIVYDVYRGARNQFLQLPTSLGDQLATLDPSPDAQVAIRALRSARDDVPSIRS